MAQRARVDILEMRNMQAESVINMVSAALAQSGVYSKHCQGGRLNTWPQLLQHPPAERRDGSSPLELGQVL